MSGTKLLLLEYEGDILAEYFSDFFLSVSDNIYLLSGAHSGECFRHPADQRFSGSQLDDFGMIGHHSLTFTCCHNNCTKLHIYVSPLGSSDALFRAQKPQ